MSKPYQIESRRAMRRFEASLRENQEPVQLLLLSVEIALAMKFGACVSAGRKIPCTLLSGYHAVVCR